MLTWFCFKPSVKIMWKNFAYFGIRVAEYLRTDNGIAVIYGDDRLDLVDDILAGKVHHVDSPRRLEHPILRHRT